jgi:CTP:molybdopterin cytidylyltransferase MocA
VNRGVPGLLPAASVATRSARVRDDRVNNVCMVAAVVLAAGGSTRFGSPKQRLLLEPILERVRAAAAVDDVVVVTGAHELETDARVVRCPEWELGPGASLRCGLAALDAGAEAAVVVLADGPQLAPEAVDRVVGAWRDGAGEIVAASYGGNRGHPVVLDRRRWEEIPNEGARALTPVLVPCDDLGPPGDVDTPADLGDDATETRPAG